MEIWKDIEGYEGLYQVSNLGNIKSVERLIAYNNVFTNDRLYRLKKDSIKSIQLCKGYNSINLSKDNISLTKRCCRIVAKHFVPNPQNKPHVNHINGIKTDDRAINLEWVTPTENMVHASKNNLLNFNPYSKKVRCKKSGKVFSSLKEAALFVSKSQGQLSRILKGKYKNNTSLELCQDV